MSDAFQMNKTSLRVLLPYMDGDVDCHDWNSSSIPKHVAVNISVNSNDRHQSSSDIDS